MNDGTEILDKKMFKTAISRRLIFKKHYFSIDISNEVAKYREEYEGICTENSMTIK